MKTLVVIPNRKLSVFTPPMHEAWRVGLPATVLPQEEDGSFPPLADYDIVISRIKFRHLMRMPEIDWSGFGGLRVHSDDDGFWDALWSTSPYLGQWQTHIPRHGFDLMVVTGVRAHEHFQSLGIETIVVHKGFDPATFYDRRQPRSETLVMYGADYLSRVIARDHLARAGVKVQRISAPFEQLNDELNRHLACLVCTLDAPTLNRGVRSVWDRMLRRTPDIAPGPEPMHKLFESAASGCATFTDWSPDLEQLGFVDGQNIIIYRSIEELVEKARHFLTRPDELRRIGAAGSELARSRHTWEKRTEVLRAALLQHAAMRSDHVSPHRGARR